MRHQFAKLAVVEGIERKGLSTVETAAKAIPVTIGLDIKNFVQVHAVDDAGQVVLRRKLSRGEVLGFFEAQPKAMVGIEAWSELFNTDSKYAPAKCSRAA